MSIHTTSFDGFFPPPKPGRNTQRLGPNRVYGVETKLRKTNNEEVELDRVKRYVEKLLRFHIELARGEEECTKNTIRKAVIRGGCLVNVRKLTHAIEVDIAWKNHLDTEGLAYIRGWMDKICAGVDDGDGTKSIADSMIETDGLSQNMPNILFGKEKLSIEDLISKNGEFSFFITGTNRESELMKTVYAAFHTIPDAYGMMQLVKIYVHDTIGIAVALEGLETYENHLIGRPQAIQYLRSFL